MAKKRKNTKRSAASSSTHLPNAELDVMACLWKDGQSTARNIRETMLSYRPMAHGSVVTLLTRLEAKGMVTKKKGSFGKAFIFKPARTPETTYRSLAKDLVRRVFAGDNARMVSSLFEAHPPTKTEIAKIQTLVSSAKRKAKTTRR